MRLNISVHNDLHQSEFYFSQLCHNTTSTNTMIMFIYPTSTCMHDKIVSPIQLLCTVIFHQFSFHLHHTAVLSQSSFYVYNFSSLKLALALIKIQIPHIYYVLFTRNNNTQYDSHKCQIQRACQFVYTSSISFLTSRTISPQIHINEHGRADRWPIIIVSQQIKRKREKKQKKNKGHRV